MGQGGVGWGVRGGGAGWGTYPTMHWGIGTPPPPVNRQTENITFARFAKRAVMIHFTLTFNTFTVDIVRILPYTLKLKLVQ